MKKLAFMTTLFIAALSAAYSTFSTAAEPSVPATTSSGWTFVLYEELSVSKVDLASNRIVGTPGGAGAARNA